MMIGLLSSDLQLRLSRIERTLQQISIVISLLGSRVVSWLACWTQAQQGLGTNRSRDAVG